MRRLANGLGCTEGQAYTLVIGAVFAVLLATTGLGPALSHDAASRAADAADAAAGDGPEPVPTSAAPDGATTTTPVVTDDGQLVLPPLPDPPTDASPVTEPESVVPTTTTPDGSAPPTPLRIARKGYTSTAAGTPLATVGVPDGSLPVAAFVGQPEKESYFTLTGDGIALELHESSAAGANFGQDQAQILVCKVTETGWELPPGSAPEEAPDYDADRCVDGVRSSEGTWLFDLTPFGEAADDAGFALTPSEESTATFQVSLVQG